MTNPPTHPRQPWAQAFSFLAISQKDKKMRNRTNAYTILCIPEIGGKLND